MWAQSSRAPSVRLGEIHIHESRQGGRASITAEALAIPPSILLTLLICWFHGSLFFLLGATRGRQLLFYLTLATLGGLGGQALAMSQRLQTALDVGDCSVVLVTVGCWLGFGLTRVVRASSPPQPYP